MSAFSVLQAEGADGVSEPFARRTIEKYINKGNKNENRNWQFQISQFEHQKSSISNRNQRVIGIELMISNSVIYWDENESEIESSGIYEKMVYLHLSSSSGCLAQPSMLSGYRQTLSHKYCSGRRTYALQGGEYVNSPNKPTFEL